MWWLQALCGHHESQHHGSGLEWPPDLLWAEHSTDRGRMRERLVAHQNARVIRVKRRRAGRCVTGGTWNQWARGQPEEEA